MHDNNNEQDNQQPAAENGWQTPGIVLRKARRERGLSEEEVCERLGLIPSALRALESDDYSRLPAAIYVRGYIRSYCALLGIAEKEVLDCYQAYRKELGLGEEQEPSGEQPKEVLPAWKRPLFWGVATLVMVVLILWLVLGTSADTEASEFPRQNPGAEWLQTDAQSLQLRFEAAAWVEVVDSRQDILLATMKQPGDQVVVKGQPPFELRLSDVAAAKIYYAGRPVEVKSAPGTKMVELTIGSL